MPDWLKRICRTLFQASTAGVVTGALAAFGVVQGEVKVGALLALLTVVFSALQNGLEEADVVPKMLK
jgi:hypothetical protein